jgi:hypothetical protein
MGANKVTVHRRSSDDPLWKKLREDLRKRDPICRVLRCLTMTEAKGLKVPAGGRLDAAHMFAASHYPELIYDMKNVYRISHQFHANLDDYRDPLTGDVLDKNEWAWWWTRIANCSQVKYDPETNYEDEMRKIVGLVY